MIKNILFDLDEVLVDCNHSYLTFLHTLPEYKDVTLADFPRLFPDDFWMGSYELNDRFKDAWLAHPSWGDRPIFPGALDTLERLKHKGYKMAIITAASGRADEKREWVRKRLGDYIGDIEVCLHGDKTRFILEILKRHKLKAEETVLIDDRFANLHSAINAGIKAVWRKPNLGHDKLPPDLAHLPTVNNLEEFETWLRNEQ